MIDYSYIRLIYELLQEYLVPLASDVHLILSKVDMLLQSGIFFGLLFTAFNFVSKRWLTLNG